jgi:alpha-L-fucosidase
MAKLTTSTEWLSTGAASKGENMPDMEWFKEAKFGLFIHWDHSSVQGVEIGWPLVDRSIIDRGDGSAEDKVSIAQYQQTAEVFNPVHWDAPALAKLARRCGLRYAVFTTRHHAGFSMFHSAVSDFGIEHTAFQRDVVKEYVDAFRAEGLKIGFYYSLSDWNHVDYPRFEESDKPYPRQPDQPYDRSRFRRSSPEAWERYLHYVSTQMTELLTNYGQIDLLWFDGEWEREAEEWKASEIRELIRSLQPNTIVNDRLPGQGDYLTPEQSLPNRQPEGAWETALTMKDGWGFRFNDTSYKSTRELLRHLIEAAGMGGNLLLNVSPDGLGAIPAIEVAKLKEIGSWLTTHGEAIFDTKPANKRAQFYGPMTVSGNKLYLHLLMEPKEMLIVRGIPVKRIRKVTQLGSELELDYTFMVEVHLESKLGGDALGELRVPAPASTGAMVDVVVIEFDGQVWVD